MDPLSNRIVTIVDRLAHASTTDQDVLQTVYGLRRVMKNQTPSAVMRYAVPILASQKQKQIADLQKTVVVLRDEIAELQKVNTKLEVEQAWLRTQISQHQQKCRQPDSPDDYLYDDVMQIIRHKFGKQNGAQTLWSDYSATLHAADAAIQVVTVSKLQAWRTGGSYPAWAVNQLKAMPVSTRTVHRWSDEDIEFLCRLHLADLQKTDDCLAYECSAKFGCTINSNSIKSKFNILRKTGRIPKVRRGSPSAGVA